MRRRPQDGFTILELMVTVLLLTVVGAVLFDFLDSTTAVTARATRNVSAEQAGQLALRTLTQDIRGANPVASTYPTTPTSCPAGGSYPASYGRCLRLVMVRSDTAGPTCIGPDGLAVQSPYSVITYALAGERVLQDRTDYTAGCVVSRSWAGRVIIEGAVNPAGTPLFTFLDRNGVATTDLASGSSVRVAITVRYQPNAPLLSLASTVALRNYR